MFSLRGGQIGSEVGDDGTGPGPPRHPSPFSRKARALGVNEMECLGIGKTPTMRYVFKKSARLDIRITTKAGVFDTFF